MDITSPIRLEGQTVRLEPLSMQHYPDLLELIFDSDLQYQFNFFNGRPDTPEHLQAWIENLVTLSQEPTWKAFAVIELSSHKAIGSTSYLDISPKDKRYEIGSTWYGRRFWRTKINSECKYLLLQYAFETLEANRVQLKTDLRNQRSQAAIERLGAVREGILRAHMVLPDGYVRDSVMYSIIRSEWPAVKARLEGFLAGPQN